MNFATKPSRKRTAHNWLDYLRESHGLGGILAKTEDLAKLKATLALALAKFDLEYLNPKIEVGWRSGTQNELFLLVGSASIATRLQQILPSLIKELVKLGLPCTAIKVQIKPAPSRWEIKPSLDTPRRQKPKGLNEVARRSWEELLNRLPTESDLRKAVERLLQNKPK